MSIIKCKMCGGDIELSADKTYGTCDSCGSTMTLPKVDDEQRVNLFNRANHFRRQNEFDKAISAYERILDEDNTNAEAHWGVVLSRFGIEYVEDPVTHERIPTCHRVQAASILTDADYLAAVEYAPDRFSCSLYKTEAKRIADIQKGILAISAQEKPYDVFICYKESTDGGSRTKDSTLAQDIYYQLQQEGFKVFFARITLEDKLGQQYEPYIFAALNSAKVMLVVGTKPEYYNAVWVKNEWSRYLALMKQDRSRMLIPCYRDMDAYDLPEELSMLQSQDMSKIGFMQDLIRGVRKILSADAPDKAVQSNAVPVVGMAAPLLKRAFMFLEDGDFQTADEYCEKVLDMDPENAEAYLGKLMAELHVTKREQLANLPETFDNLGNYQKASRFSKTIQAELQQYTIHINTRNEHARIVGIYEQAEQKMKSADEEEKYTAAAKLFESIAQYEDAEKRAQECHAKAEECRKNEVYFSAKNNMQCADSSRCELALKLFESISGWKDADALAAECANKIDELRAKEIADRRKRERQEKIAREKAEKRTKRNKIIVTAAVVITCIAVIFVIVVNNVIVPLIEYNRAVTLLNNGDEEAAIVAFQELGMYSDADERWKMIYYQLAEEKLAAGEWETASQAFASAGDYSDATFRISEPYYWKAEALLAKGDEEGAIAAFQAAGTYSNADERWKNLYYQRAETLTEEKKYREAIYTFYSIAGYKDSIKQAEQLEQLEIKLANVGDYVLFGTYEQDNNILNGKEPIEWLVLAKEKGRILVVSRCALDSKPFNETDASITWDSSTLRKWLNKEFINAAFSEIEMKVIPTVTVSAHRHPKYYTNSGKDTQDKVFLLSAYEVDMYFADEDARRCEPSMYAASGSYYGWWLRTRAKYDNSAECIGSTGKFTRYGIMVDAENTYVRPAMWIDVE